MKKPAESGALSDSHGTFCLQASTCDSMGGREIYSTRIVVEVMEITLNFALFQISLPPMLLHTLTYCIPLQQCPVHTIQDALCNLHSNYLLFSEAPRASCFVLVISPQICYHSGPEVNPETRDKAPQPVTTPIVTDFIQRYLQDVSTEPSICEMCLYTVSGHLQTDMYTYSLQCSYAPDVTHAHVIISPPPSFRADLLLRNKAFIG